MKVVESAADLRAHLDSERASGALVGFVPTMGALHAGHRSLIDRARSDCDVVVVSIFVNPLQFGPGEDFSKYPRTWDDDLRICEEAGADVVFHPGPDDMYPRGGPVVRLSAGPLGEPLCGRTRPGHFDGVATVVAKLFNATGPCRAYFGRKDAQQLVVIRALVRDLNFPIDVVGLPTIREEDGLAMSSRNRYLDPSERGAATVLVRALREAEAAIEAGERDGGRIARQMGEKISSEPLARLDYSACVDPETLAKVEGIQGPVLLAVAAWVGRARLIDNMTATPRGAAIEEV